MKKFLRELLIYSISFLLILFLTSQLFSLEKRPIYTSIKSNAEGSVYTQTYTLTNITNTQTYTMPSQKVVTSTSSQSSAKEKESLQEEIQNPSQIIYEVKVGDTIIGIAQKYGISWQELAKINKLKDPNYLVVGQKLIIPLNNK
jgi:LysM repeat protein